MSPKLEYQDIRQIYKFVETMVAEHLLYIKKGFAITEIAETFARIYSSQFENALDPETIEILNKDSSLSRLRGSQKKSDLTKSVCLQMSIGFLETITHLRDNKRK